MVGLLRMTKKVLICGSRDWGNRTSIEEDVLKFSKHTIVITGGAKGADTIAEELAIRSGLFVAVVKAHDYHWECYNKRAGILRNNAMLDLNPDLVIAYQKNNSRGTQYTIDEAKRREIPVLIRRES